MKRLAALSVLLAVVLATTLNASIPLPPGQSVFSCSTLFPSSGPPSVNGQPLVSPAIANYSSYGGLISVTLLVVMMMFVVMGLIYGLGMAFRWEMLKSLAKSEYLEGFVSILIIIFIAGGIAAFNGAESIIGGLFSASNITSAPGTFSTLYSSLCGNIFDNMVIPGFLLTLWFDINKLIVSLIASFTLSFAPGGMGITVAPFAGFSTLNQLLWTEGALATFMLATGGMLIVMLFVIYYLFPLFLFFGVALRAFPWTRAAGGAFIALFIGFYIVFPAIMYPFTVPYSPATNTINGNVMAICNTKTSNCPSGIGLAFGSLSQYLGVINLDIGYSAYTNLLYFSQILVYAVLDLAGLIIALLISYDLVSIFGGLLGSRAVNATGLFDKIIRGK